MGNDALSKVEQFIRGKLKGSADKFQPPPASADEKVDAEILEGLLSDTYEGTGRSSEEVTKWLLKTIEDYDDTKKPETLESPVQPEKNENTSSSSSESDVASSEEGSKYVTMRTFSNFIDRRMKRLKEIFGRIDKDKDARISLQDVFTYLDEHKLSYEPEKVEYVYNIFDKNQDGHVSLDDFVRHLLLVPTYGRRSDGRFFYRAYDFFVEDLDMSSDSDVVISKDIHNGLGYFYAGGVAGAVSRTCTAPFDRLKVYLIANTIDHGPTTLKQAIRDIYHNGSPPGLLAFFTGNGLNVLKVLPESAMKFGAFESAKRVFARIEGVSDPADLSRVATFLAGGIGGMISQFFVYPLDTVKFRVQVAAQNGENIRGHILPYVLKGMIRDGGIRSFYRGLYVGVLGIFPFAALDLGIFSMMKTAYIRREASRRGVDESEVQPGNLQVLSMGAISGSIGATVVYPVNLIRTRIQTQGTPSHPHEYRGFMDCYRQSVSREGWRGLFRGLGPNLAKVAPSISISYLVYEKSKAVMGLP